MKACGNFKYSKIKVNQREWGRMAYQPIKQLYQKARNIVLAAPVTLGLGGLELAMNGTHEAHAIETNATGYNQLIPDLKGLKPTHKFNMDVDKDIPGKKTTVVQYELPNKEIAAQISVGNQVFAYSVGNYKKKTGYTIRDTTGDGIFTEKYHLTELVYLPEWVKSNKLEKK